MLKFVNLRILKKKKPHMKFFFQNLCAEKCIKEQQVRQNVKERSDFVKKKHM